MKKLLCLVLAALMCMTGFTFAFAEEGGALEADYPEYGFTLRLPGDFNHLKGIVQPTGSVSLHENVDFAALDVSSIAVSRVEAEKPAEAEKPVEDKPSYTVTVVDQNGDPVPGASVGFCLETGCVPVDTDDNGVATFHGAPNRYHIQVVDAPDEYDYPDESDVYIGPESGEVTLTITKL